MFWAKNGLIDTCPFNIIICYAQRLIYLLRGKKSDPVSLEYIFNRIENQTLISRLNKSL
jgi:hypothetical protein